MTDPDLMAAPDGAEVRLLLGIGAGLEPPTASPDETATGVVITRSSSWWNRTRCQTCGHTFRRGDRALVDAAARTARHLVPGLPCGTHPETGGTEAGPTAADERDEFIAGMLSAWPSRVPVTRISPADPRLPRPGRDVVSPACLYCGHSFRIGEYVVTCPCQSSQGEPPACAAAVHRDPTAGLPCWDKWQPAGTLAVCPTTAARL
jgi:hypothetical protein